MFASGRKLQRLDEGSVMSIRKLLSLPSMSGPPTGKVKQSTQYPPRAARRTTRCREVGSLLLPDPIPALRRLHALEPHRVLFISEGALDYWSEDLLELVSLA
jgi:hypothetical protein